MDAATRDSLKAIDRPLFKDFWERFLECLRLLRDKRQRTVYRSPAPEHCVCMPSSPLTFTRVQDCRYLLPSAPRLLLCRRVNSNKVKRLLLRPHTLSG